MLEQRFKEYDEENHDQYLGAGKEVFPAKERASTEALRLESF